MKIRSRTRRGRPTRLNEPGCYAFKLPEGVSFVHTDEYHVWFDALSAKSDKPYSGPLLTGLAGRIDGIRIVRTGEEVEL